jgi:hypothetical protein
VTDTSQRPVNTEAEYNAACAEICKLRQDSILFRRALENLIGTWRQTADELRESRYSEWAKHLDESAEDLERVMNTNAVNSTSSTQIR